MAEAAITELYNCSSGWRFRLSLGTTLLEWFLDVPGLSDSVRPCLFLQDPGQALEVAFGVALWFVAGALYTGAACQSPNLSLRTLVRRPPWQTATDARADRPLEGPHPC